MSTAKGNIPEEAVVTWAVSCPAMDIGRIGIDEVIVGWLRYKIEEVDEVVIDGDTEYTGSADDVKQRIEVVRSLPRLRKFHTVLHEVFHVLGFQTGHILDEGVVTALAYGMTQVVLNNPGFFTKFIEAGSLHQADRHGGNE